MSNSVRCHVAAHSLPLKVDPVLADSGQMHARPAKPCWHEGVKWIDVPRLPLLVVYRLALEKVDYNVAE